MVSWERSDLEWESESKHNEEGDHFGEGMAVEMGDYIHSAIDQISKNNKNNTCRGKEQPFGKGKN